jgi:hypothetical protein
LQSEGKQQRCEGVALLDPALREDYSPGGLVHEDVVVPAIGPYHHGKQGWAALLDSGQHLVPARGVEGVLPVHLHGDAGRAAAMPARRACPTTWLPPQTPKVSCSGDRVRLASGQERRGRRACTRLCRLRWARCLGKGEEAGVEEAGCYDTTLIFLEYEIVSMGRGSMNVDVAVRC